MRPSGRDLSEMRPVSIETGFTKHAEGSCLISVGDTRVLCTATIEDRVPPFIKGSGLGWVTAEYGMLPRATNTRMRREAASGKQGGRTVEIQRLIGRALRAGVDRSALGERQITVDCDVIQADGGTRTAAITGAWVALKQATGYLIEEGLLKEDPVYGQLAAISCGVIDGETRLDLEYEEDRRAEADANFVLTSDGGIVEIQAPAEDKPIPESDFTELFSLAKAGVKDLCEAQLAALKG